MAGAATVGGAAGVSTQSFLADGELFESNSAEAGSLELEIATCSEFEGEGTCTQGFPASFEQGSTVDVAFQNIDGAASGSTTIAYRSCDNPGRAWFRAFSEELSDGEQSALADAIQVELSHASDCGAEGTSLFEDGSLTGFLDEYNDGARPRENSCLECDPDCLTLDWELRDTEGLGGEDLSVTLELRAQQCRNTEGSNPWQ